MPNNNNGNHLGDVERLEGLEMLEPEVVEKEGKRPQPQQSEELPDTLYRMRMLHSSETFYGYFVPPTATTWPRFRTERELEALLEGPVAAESDEGNAVALEETKSDGEPLVSEAESEPESEPGFGGDTATLPLIPARALVLAPTKYGKDIVEVQGVAVDTAFVNPDELVAIERPASIDDLRKLKENKEKEQHAYELCRDKIWARNLPMKLVSAHFLIDEPKILFYFTAESRVDFRELVKDLVSLFKMRIELRQIGVRDEARVTGGCGVCGRVLCCHGISDRLNPVSIKMAKDQNLSLNSLKISGPCGRLLCCLSYEYQFYRDARRELPQEGVKFTYDGTLFKVVEVNALSSTVKMAGEDGRVLDMKAERFKYSEGRWKVIEEQAE